MIKSCKGNIVRDRNIIILRHHQRIPSQARSKYIFATVGTSIGNLLGTECPVRPLHPW